MPVSTAETTKVAPETTVADRIVDAVRHAAHFSHEARLVKSMARDAVEEGAHTANRAIKRVRRGVETLEDFKDEAVHYVKRQPLKAVGIAAGIGLLLGLVIVAAGVRFGQRHVPRSQ